MMFSPFLKGIKITTRLVIKKNGKVVVDKEVDLVTRWWERIFNACLGTYGTVSGLYGTGPLTEEGGTTKDTRINNLAADLTYWGPRSFIYYHGSVAYIKIAIGSGAPTPTLDSYALLTKEYEASSPSRTTYEYEAGRFEVILSVTFGIDKTVTIQEAGIFHRIRCTDLTEYWFMLSHDTFTPVDLVAGDSLTVEYRQRIEA